jgi:hypothetical protein
MKALTITQVILWDDGKYTFATTAADRDAVPFVSCGGGQRYDEESIKEHLIDVKAQIDRWNSHPCKNIA